MDAASSVDYFALLDEPRQPWLEPEALKTKFLALSAQAHPDRVHGAEAAERQAANARFALLNAAYKALRDPKERLLHLLELELGAQPKDVQRIPPGTIDLFVQVGQTCREVDAFLAARARVNSPLAKVQMFERGMAWTDNLTALRQDLDRQRHALLGELRQLNDLWAAAPPPGSPARRAALPLERLEAVYRLLSYLGRWTDQLQERTVQLALT